jgi:signal recognition particle subunit SRP54
MLPGAAQMKRQIDNFDDGEITRTQAIVQSMTPLERRDPKVLNGSRRSRIAKGAGRAVSEVNSLVERFTQAQKMMRQMRNGQMPQGLPPAMAGMGAGMPRPQGAKVISKKKSKSGNPAKRALEERG